MIERTAWVQDEAGRNREVERVHRLVGRSIVSVRYFEIVYPAGDAAWHGDDFHALDFGLEIDLDNTTTWSFIWQQAGSNEALLAYEGQLVGNQLRADGVFQIWPVGESDQWQAVTRRPIAAVGSAWEHWDADLCPVTWTLTVEGGGWVAVTLGTRDERGVFRGSHDDVAVFFDRSIAHAAGVTLPV